MPSMGAMGRGYNASDALVFRHCSRRRSWWWWQVLVVVGAVGCCSWMLEQLGTFAWAAMRSGGANGAPAGSNALGSSLSGSKRSEGRRTHVPGGSPTPWSPSPPCLELYNDKRWPTSLVGGERPRWLMDAIPKKKKCGLWLFVFEGNGGNPSSNLEIITNTSRTKRFCA